MQNSNQNYISVCFSQMWKHTSYLLHNISVFTLPVFTTHFSLLNTFYLNPQKTWRVSIMEMESSEEMSFRDPSGTPYTLIAALASAYIVQIHRANLYSYLLEIDVTLSISMELHLLRGECGLFYTETSAIHRYRRVSGRLNSGFLWF